MINHTGIELLREWSPDMGPPEVSGITTFWRIGPLAPWTAIPWRRIEAIRLRGTASPGTGFQGTLHGLDLFEPRLVDLPEGLSGRRTRRFCEDGSRTT